MWTAPSSQHPYVAAFVVTTTCSAGLAGTGARMLPPLSSYAAALDRHKEFGEVVRIGPRASEPAGQEETFAGFEGFRPPARIGNRN